MRPTPRGAYRSAQYSASLGRPGSQPYNNQTPSAPIVPGRPNGNVYSDNPTIMAERSSATFKRRGDFGTAQQKRGRGEAPGSWMPPRHAIPVGLNRTTNMSGTVPNGTVPGFAGAPMQPPPSSTPVGADWSGVPSKPPGIRTPRSSNAMVAGSASAGNPFVQMTGAGQADVGAPNPWLQIDVNEAISRTNSDENVGMPDQASKNVLVLDAASAARSKYNLRGLMLFQLRQLTMAQSSTIARWNPDHALGPGVHVTCLAELNRHLAFSEMRSDDPSKQLTIEEVMRSYSFIGLAGGEEGQTYLDMDDMDRPATNTNRVIAITLQGKENGTNHWGRNLQPHQPVGFLIKRVPLSHIVASNADVSGSFNVNPASPGDVQVVDPTIYTSTPFQVVPWYDKKGMRKEPTIAERSYYGLHGEICIAEYIFAGSFFQYIGPVGSDVHIQRASRSVASSFAAGQVRLDLNVMPY